jgi:Tetratricopeptide repeat/Anaphase-promoting complex subunit 5
MYKNRITKWKLDKRNKEPEMMAVIRKKCQRDAVRKASEFHIRGRLVDLDRVHRYLKRKGMSIENAIELSAATPPELRCSTPDAVPRPLVNPEIFEGPQRVIAEIRNYVFGSLDSKMWFLPAGHYAYLNARGTGPRAAVADFQIKLWTACHLLNAGSHVRAGQFLVSASALIRDILLEEIPRTLGTVFHVMTLLCEHGWVDCSGIIFKQFSRMAMTIFPEMHPLRQIFNLLQSLEPEFAENFLPNVWEGWIDIFEEALDASSLTVLQARLRYIVKVEMARNPDNADAQLRTIVERCREVHGRFDCRYGEATLVLAIFLQHHGRYVEAMAMVEEAIRCASEGRFRYANYMWCECMDTLAFIQYLNYEDEEAQSTLRQVIDVRSTREGWHAGSTLRSLTTLGTWLTQFGKHEEAAEVLEQVTEILRQSNVFV